MIRIVIAEDQEMLLGAIGSLLNLEEDMEVVGKARNGEEALVLVNRFQPDVCIMDIEMPEMSGLEAAEELKPLGCKVIMLTTFARTGYFGRAIEADVRGYLLKDSPSEELVSSIRSIINGDRIYSPDLMDEESSYDGGKGLVQLLPDKQRGNETSSPGKVKNYLTTILDKIKLPTG